ncbi:MAG TPA: hypothetical protein VE869_00960 [Gemmatimonas sp.]|nr:hypothetical protein [Gemmatimonas sp.]
MSVVPAQAVPAQVAQAQDTVPKPRALQDLLADASRRNVLPPELLAYKAQVETEVAVLIRRDEGTEAVAAIEDVASALRWTRSGVYDQRVTGYRAQRVGFNVSMLSAVRTGWLNPTLYGNRLRVRARANSPATRVNSGMRRDGSDTLPAVHPLATDRERFYRYSGGDTIVTLRSGERTIPIARVRVQPRTDVSGQVLLFDGELDLDASRGALVRMRGHFVRINEQRGMVARLVEAVAFIEYENAEYEGNFWLPARQRIELQAASPMTGEGRAVVRIVSRFGPIAVNDTTLADSVTIAARTVRRFSYAPQDSIDRYDRWRGPIGYLLEGTHSDDFNDVGPNRWRTTGAPRLDYTTPRGSDILHFNRVEGLYTGAGVKLSMRDLAPGVVLRANAGWAWGEGTARGRASVERTRGPWTLELRGGRSIDNTNDFRNPLDSGSTLGALIGSVDPYDYVDRSSGALSAVRRVGNRSLIARVDLGVGDDRYRGNSYTRGPFGGPRYRANRGVDEGSYVRTAALLEWHPDVSAEFVRPGVGARLAYERGDGTLAWQRTEVRLVARQLFGPFTAVARADGGIVSGARIPAQQLFEIGNNQGLPGYGDKEFAGSRAAIVRAGLIYLSPWLQRPMRIGRRLIFPPVAPGLSIGVQSGWTELPDAAARAAVLRLGTTVDSTGATVPVSRETERVRATVSAGLRFFSGSVFVGAARAVDQAARWKSLVVFGQQW